MMSMTELAGGELCLPQRPHNQVRAARSFIDPHKRNISNKNPISCCNYFIANIYKQTPTNHVVQTGVGIVLLDSVSLYDR